MDISYEESQSPKFYIAQIVMRVFVIGLSLAGAIIMITSTQHGVTYMIPFTASYTMSSALKYKVVADLLPCILSVLSVIVVIALNRPKTNPSNYFYLLVVDLVSLVLLVCGFSAGAAIGIVGKYGGANGSWNEICSYANIFCDKSTISFAASFVAVICLIILVLMSAHKLKSVAHADS